MNLDILLISLFATSSALLGICVGMLNSTYSTLLSPHIQENNLILGDKDYKKILEKTSVMVIIAGALFWGNSVFALYQMWTATTDFIIYSIILFVVAGFLVFLSLIHDRLKIGIGWAFPAVRNKPEVPKTK